jgi:MoaA/NifB/PqqE/SkfB family radical SAM enzyme
LEFKNRTFNHFYNGTVLTKKDYEKLKNSSNIAMIIIIEEIQTNNGRRGKGVYKKAMDTIQKLNNIGIPNLEYRYDYKGKL